MSSAGLASIPLHHRANVRRYRAMYKAGISIDAIAQRMFVDRVSSEESVAYLPLVVDDQVPVVEGVDPVPVDLKNVIIPKALNARVDKENRLLPFQLRRYRHMISAGVPNGAVIQTMVLDGFSRPEASKLFYSLLENNLPVSEDKKESSLSLEVDTASSSSFESPKKVVSSSSSSLEVGTASSSSFESPAVSSPAKKEEEKSACNAQGAIVQPKVELSVIENKAFLVQHAVPVKTCDSLVEFAKTSSDASTSSVPVSDSELSTTLFSLISPHLPESLPGGRRLTRLASPLHLSWHSHRHLDHGLKKPEISVSKAHNDASVFSFVLFLNDSRSDLVGGAIGLMDPSSSFELPVTVFPETGALLLFQQRGLRFEFKDVPEGTAFVLQGSVMYSTPRLDRIPRNPQIILRVQPDSSPSSSSSSSSSSGASGPIPRQHHVKMALAGHPRSVIIQRAMTDGVFDHRRADAHLFNSYADACFEEAHRLRSARIPTQPTASSSSSSSSSVALGNPSSVDLPPLVDYFAMLKEGKDAGEVARLMVRLSRADPDVASFVALVLSRLAQEQALLE